MAKKIDGGDSWVILDGDNKTKIPKAGMTPDQQVMLESIPLAPGSMPAGPDIGITPPGLPTVPQPDAIAGMPTPPPVAPGPDMMGGFQPGQAMPDFQMGPPPTPDAIAGMPTPAPTGTAGDLSINQGDIKIGQPTAVAGTGMPKAGLPADTPAPVSPLQQQQQERQDMIERQKEQEVERQKSVQSQMDRIADMRDQISTGKIDSKHWWRGDRKSTEQVEAKVLKREREKNIELQKNWKEGDPKIKGLNDEELKQKVADEPAEYEGGWGTRIRLAIAAGLQSYAGAISGGDPNAGSKYLDRLIDRDIKTQRMELDKNKDKLQHEVNSLGMMRSMFGDERSAELAQRSNMMEGIKLKMTELRDGTKNENAKTQLDMMGDQYIQKQNEFDQTIRVQEYDAVTRRMNLQQKQKAAAGKEAKEGMLTEKYAKGMAGAFSSIGSLDEIGRLHKGMVDKSSGLDVSGLPVARAAVGWAGEKLGFETDVTEFNTGMGLAKAAYMKEVSGAAVSEPEMKRLSALFPKAGDSAAVASSKLKQLHREKIEKIREEIDAQESRGVNMKEWRSKLNDMELAAQPSVDIQSQ